MGAASRASSLAYLLGGLLLGGRLLLDDQLLLDGLLGLGSRLLRGLLLRRLLRCGFLSGDLFSSGDGQRRAAKVNVGALELTRRWAWRLG